MLGDRLNPVALITGAAFGVGAAMVQRMAEKATGGLILIDLDEEGLDAVADALVNPPERVSTLAFDVADPARWRQAGEFIADHYGRLDWALVSADATHAGLITDADLEDWRQVGSVNLDGAYLSMKSITPLMRANALGGSVVITASAAAAHGASKAGLLQLMRTQAREGEVTGVRVNAVVPDGSDSLTMWRSAPVFAELAQETGGPRGAFDRLSESATPIARCAGADDVPLLIEMLLTGEAAITGATLVVEDGYSI